MNSLLSKIIKKTILPEKKGPEGETLEFTDFEMAKGFRELKINVFRAIRDIFLIGLGIASAAFGLEGFLLPSKFIDGGATGISLLISETRRSVSSIRWTQQRSQSRSHHRLSRAR